MKMSTMEMYKTILRADHIDVKLFNDKELRNCFVGLIQAYIDTKNELAIEIIYDLEEDIANKEVRGYDEDLKLIQKVKSFVKKETNYDIGHVFSN